MMSCIKQDWMKIVHAKLSILKQVLNKPLPQNVWGVLQPSKSKCCLYLQNKMKLISENNREFKNPIFIMLVCCIFCMETNELALISVQLVKNCFNRFDPQHIFFHTTGGFISSGALDYYRQVCLIKIGTDLHADRSSET